MNKQSLTRSWGRATLQAKKNSPHIFFGAGLAGVVVSAVMACRATLKLEKELDAIKTDLESVRENKELIEESGGEYSRRDYAQEMGGAYLRTSMTVVKLYGPSIVVGSISIVALSGSHVQLTRRNAALSSSLAALTKAFSEYRDRIRGEIGEERELELYHCMEDNEIEGPDGKKELVKVGPPEGAPFGSSPYAAKFGRDTTKMFQNSMGNNRVFIELMQHQANLRLQANGHVFLNEVYDWLGLPRTTAGAIVGWVYNSQNGDNYIDFCMYDPNADVKVPYDRCLWLDFNVDGPIFESLG